MTLFAYLNSQEYKDKVLDLRNFLNFCRFIHLLYCLDFISQDDALKLIDNYK